MRTTLMLIGIGGLVMVHRLWFRDPTPDLISDDERLGYRLQKQEPLDEGLRRIALEQLDAALYKLYNFKQDPEEYIHDVRKRLKKLRAIVRLVRADLGEAVYKTENVTFRDAGRMLSDVRDSATVRETLTDLVVEYAEVLEADPYAQFAQTLQAEHIEARQAFLDDDATIQTVIEMLLSARKRIHHWEIGPHEFDTLAGGIHKVYKRGWKGMQKDPSTENLHDWRKRVKYRWYHARILRVLWPPVFEVMADEIHALSDLLGDDHDLAVLHEVAIDHADSFASEKALQSLLAFIEHKRSKLQAEIFELAPKLYFDKPDTYIDRLELCWEVH